MNERPCMLGLQAADQSQLRLAAGAFARSLRDPTSPTPEENPPGRFRLLARTTTPESLRESLAAFAAGEDDPAIKVGEQAGEQPRIAFVFAGQSETRAGMGAELYRESRCYAEVIDRCSAAMGEILETTLAAALYESEDPNLLEDARLAQPALFALQSALVALWERWGVIPEMVAGHSLGEYAAACAAGAIGIEDGTRLVAARGALTQARARHGLMAVLFTSEEWVASRTDGISIAAVNAPGVIVVSGEADAITDLVASADRQGINAKALNISHPFHSHCIDPMLDGLQHAAASMPMQQPRIPFASTLEGRFLNPGEPLDASYWRRHAREPVRFLDAMRELERAGCTIFLELGPHATLTSLGERCVDTETAQWLPSIKRSGRDWRVLLDTVGKLYLAGVNVNLPAVAGDAGWDLAYSPRTNCSTPR